MTVMQELQGRMIKMIALKKYLINTVPEILRCKHFIAVLSDVYLSKLKLLRKVLSVNSLEYGSRQDPRLATG